MEMDQTSCKTAEVGDKMLLTAFDTVTREWGKNRLLCLYVLLTILYHDLKMNEVSLKNQLSYHFQYDFDSLRGR
jgi:hypothetical protein